MTYNADLMSHLSGKTVSSNKSSAASGPQSSSSYNTRGNSRTPAGNNGVKSFSKLSNQSSTIDYIEKNKKDIERVKQRIELQK